MPKSLWKRALLGGLVLFVWSTISWMILSWHNATFRTFTHEAEVARVLKANTSGRGIYLYPGEHQTPGLKPEQQRPAVEAVRPKERTSSYEFRTLKSGTGFDIPSRAGGCGPLPPNLAAIPAGSGEGNPMEIPEGTPLKPVGSTPGNEKPQDPTPEQAARNREILKAIKAVNTAGSAGPNVELRFAIDPANRQPVIKVVDRETNEIVGQLPPEKILRAAKNLRQLQHGQ